MKSKTISNKAFTRIITMLANQPITPERLSALIDATPGEGVDVLIFGRLAKVTVIDQETFNELLSKEVQTRLWSNCELETSKPIELTVSSPMKFSVHFSYLRHCSDGKDSEDSITLECCATDDKWDDVLKFEFKD